jgi:O-antigen/teichoic acid export membrane protein
MARCPPALLPRVGGGLGRRGRRRKSNVVTRAQTTVAGGAVRLARRFGWGIADQALSSVTNFAIGIVIARLLGPQALGAFALAFSTYTVGLNVSRGLATDPLVIRFAGEEPAAWRRGTAEAAGTALIVGAAGGAICVLFGALFDRVLDPGVGLVFVALGVALPGLLVQDAWRFAFFTARRNEHAFLNDLVWTVAQLIAFAVLIWNGATEIAVLVLAWGGAASVAAIVGSFQAGIWPRPALARRWVRDHKDLGSRYVAENLSLSGEQQLRAYGVAAIAGLQTAGSLRAAELLLGPLNVIHFGLEPVALAHAVRVGRRSAQRLLNVCALLGGTLVGLTILWGAVVLLLPDRVGTAILGASWPTVDELLLPMVLFTAGTGLTAGAHVGLRALAAARRSLRTRLASSCMRLGGALAGAAGGGGVGAAWGLASGQAIATLLWWWQFGREFRGHVETREQLPDQVEGGSHLAS